MKTRPPKAALAAVHLRDIGTSRWQLNRPYTDVTCKWKRQERGASFQLALPGDGSSCCHQPQDREGARLSGYRRRCSPFDKTEQDFATHHVALKWPDPDGSACPLLRRLRGTERAFVG